MDYMGQFVDSIEDIMVREGYKVTDFCKTVGLDHAAVGRWLNKTYWPNMESVIKIADAFDISIDYLFKLTDVSCYTKAETKSTFLERFDEILSNKYMNEKRVTAYRVAKECNFKNAAISKWRNAPSLPKTENVITMAKYFNCSMDYLMGRTDSV